MSKFPAAACQKCGGWTSYGGNSHLAEGSDGCKCSTATLAPIDWVDDLLDHYFAMPIEEREALRKK